jgi:recombinational DNA repair ATPase RecF
VQQALVTTTDWADFTTEFRSRARCLHVVEGRIERYGE